MKRKNPNWQKQVIASVRAEMTRRMRTGVDIIGSEIKTLLSVSGPGRGKKTKGRDRSAPGEPPRTNNGDLRRRVSSSVTVAGNHITGKVGAYKLVYAPIHEYGGIILFPAGKSWKVAPHVRKIKGIGKPVSVRAYTATRRRAFQIIMPPRPYIAPAVKSKMSEVRKILKGGQ